MNQLPFRIFKKLKKLEINWKYKIQKFKFLKIKMKKK